MDSSLATAVVPAAGFACRLCGGMNLSLYYTLGNDGRFRYYRCADCRLVNYDLSTGLDQGQYTAEFVDPTDDRHRKNLDKDASFAFLRRYVPVPGRLLDIGCGNGRLLHLAKKAGWRVAGLELSPEYARQVAAKLGVEVQAADFLTTTPSAAERGAYDVVSLRHVLEHLPDGIAAMTRIRELLRPGGYFLAEMPNVEGWSKKWVRGLVDLGLHRRRFPEGMQAGHSNEYCRRSFEYLLERTGFEPVRWETYSKKPFSNWFLNRVPVGTKARALARRKPD